MVKKWRDRNTCALLVEIQIGLATKEKSMEVPQEIKSRTIISSSNPSSGYVSKGNENRSLKSYLHYSVHYSFMHNSQGMETT